MLIKLNIEEQNKFPYDVYSNVDVMNGEIPVLLRAKEFTINNLAYKQDELICETFATIEQLQTKNIEYTVIDEIPEGFKQLVAKTEEYGEYLTYEQIKALK